MQFEIQQMTYTLPESLSNLDASRHGIFIIDGELVVSKGPVAVVKVRDQDVLIVRNMAIVPNGEDADIHQAAHFFVTREDELPGVFHATAELDGPIPSEYIPHLVGRVDTPIGFIDISIKDGQAYVTTDHEALLCGIMHVQPSLYHLNGEWVFQHSMNSYREIKLTEK